MQWLARICVKRPVFATVLMLIIVVVGAAGYYAPLKENTNRFVKREA